MLWMICFIFRKFYQTDKSHASLGNGVGLAIVKKIVVLHEGKITVDSGNGKTSFRQGRQPFGCDRPDWLKLETFYSQFLWFFFIILSIHIQNQGVI